MKGPTHGLLLLTRRRRSKTLCYEVNLGENVKTDEKKELNMKNETNLQKC